MIAQRAAVNAGYNFGPSQASPPTMNASGVVVYFGIDDEGNAVTVTKDSINVNNIPFDSSAREIVNALVAAIIAEQPTGFDLADSDVLMLGLVR